MFDDLPAEGIETSGGTEPVPSATTDAPPAETVSAEPPVEPQPDQAPPPEGEGDPLAPDPEANPVAEVAEVADGVEVVDGEVVPQDDTESQSVEGGATEVLAGETEPQVLDSGDVLPEHRQRVESGEPTV